jgi:hypothetical protein
VIIRFEERTVIQTYITNLRLILFQEENWRSNTLNLSDQWLLTPEYKPGVEVHRQALVFEERSKCVNEFDI